MSQKKWKLKNVDKELAAQLSQAYDLNPFLALIMVSRGCTGSDALAQYAPDALSLTDPFALSGIKEAAQRIRLALDTGEPIAVYGDFDADGVTATALMCTFLESEGGNVISYIPEREGEGYGLNLPAMQSLAEQGIRLLITVDNGITAIEEARAAAGLEMDLIITDHHQPGAELPEAVAVVDPHLDVQLPFRDWAGVGVAFKVACAVYEGDSEDLLASFSDLVAIGTVGDIVPLRGENRFLVQKGLAVLNGGQRMGIRAFRQVTNSQDRQFTATELAFVLVPRINAAGRMDSADCALSLLTTDDYDHAMLRASQLCEYNTQRQETEQAIFEEMRAEIAQNPSRLYDRVLVMDGTHYHNGVTGIVASRMVEAYGKPCIVLNRQPDGTVRGSCRSVSGFSIYDALDACRSDLTRFGGHPMAAGLSLNDTQIEAFRQHINEYAKEQFPVMPTRELVLDCRISPAYLTLGLLEDLALLEPYGAGNEQPVFGLYHVQVTTITPVGGGKHLRLGVSKAGRNYQMMYFGMAEDRFPFKAGDTVDAAVKISRNVFNGRESVSIQICDMKPSGLDQDTYFQEIALYESLCAGETLEQGVCSSLFPGRAENAAVYRCLLKNKERPLTMDSIYFSVFEQGVTFGQLAASLDAFEETGLIRRENGFITGQPAQGKVDLEGSRALTQLKSRVNYG